MTKNSMDIKMATVPSVTNLGNIDTLIITLPRCHTAVRISNNMYNFL